MCGNLGASRPVLEAVQVPLSIRRRPGGKAVVTPEAMASPAVPRTATQTHGDPALVKALARAFRYHCMLDEGQYSCITEMAEAERLDQGYMGRLLQLTLLGAGIVEAALDERRPDRLNLPRLLRIFRRSGSGRVRC